MVPNRAAYESHLGINEAYLLNQNLQEVDPGNQYILKSWVILIQSQISEPPV